MRPRCPTCGSEFDRSAEHASFPFCSKRCRLVDLGNWLDERYRVAASFEATMGERAAPPGGDAEPEP